MKTLEYENLESIPSGWDVAFIGIHSDQRDSNIRKRLQQCCQTVITVQYERDEMQLNIADQPY